MMGQRRLRRFFSQGLGPVGTVVRLSTDETRHLKRSLRLNKGDRCLLVDGAGQEAEAKICDFLTSGETSLRIERVVDKSKQVSEVFIRIFQAFVGKGKIDFLVEKAQELGVDEFWSVMTERSGVELNKQAIPKVLNRWQKKIREAAKQSGVLKLMQLGIADGLRKAILSLPQEEPVVFFHLDPRGMDFKTWISRLSQVRAREEQVRLNLFFGPEGGFSARELEFIKRKEGDMMTRTVEFVYLGDRTLKLETAVLGVVSVLRLLLP